MAISYEHANPWHKREPAKRCGFMHCAISFSQHHRKPNPTANLIHFEIPFVSTACKNDGWTPPLTSPATQKYGLKNQGLLTPGFLFTSHDFHQSQVAFRLQIIKVQGALFLRIRGVLVRVVHVVVLSLQEAIENPCMVYLHVPYKSTKRR